MGAPITDKCLKEFLNEQFHEVTLTRGFKITEAEVTFGEFKALMGYYPINGKTACGDDCPAANVTWDEAVAYCNALSKRDSLTACYTCTGTTYQTKCQVETSYVGQKIYDCSGYRLPTEAEWEYAYRAGTTTSLYNGDATACESTSTVDPLAEVIAWYLGNSGTPSAAHPVKKKLANAWGLYDMAGNVREWCQDWYVEALGVTPVTDPVTDAGDRKLLRGGYYDQNARTLRASFRYSYEPNMTDGTVGFRCVKKL